MVRGSFDIENGKRLALAQEQETIVLEDQYYGDPTSSSLRFDSGLSPYKLCTDVIIEATAYSPSGRPQESWMSEVWVGDICKTFHVTGPRTWQRKLGIPRLSEIDPILSLPVRYEHTFGGTRSDGLRFAPNPVGVGFENKLNGHNVPVPQILPADSLNPVFGRALKPIGLGPIPPSWEPRISRAGTYDSAWKETRAPYLPQDFSFEFYNFASDGLRLSGFAKGDEVFYLSNLSQERRLKFGLPEIELMTIIQFEDGRIIPGPINLDTIEVQVDRKKVFLQWRGIFPAQIPTRAVEIRMSAPETMVEA